MARKKRPAVNKGLFDKLTSEDKKAYLKALTTGRATYGQPQQAQKNKQNYLSGLANSPEYKKYKKRQQIKKRGAL